MGRVGTGQRAWRQVVLVVAFLCVQVAVHAEQVHLIVLHSNDSHGHLMAPDGSDALGDSGGIARVATVVRQVRDENPGRVLVLHAGDVLSRGDALTVASEGRLNFRLMKRVGYDVFTPGNGEFYGGIESLLACRRASGTPFVKADVALKASGEKPFAPYVIKRLAGVRIGILGLGLVRAEHPASAPLSLLDSVEEARRYVPVLDDRADVVLVLSHLGYERDQELAAQVPGIDLIVGGHSHTVLREPTRVAGPDGRVVPVAQAGEYDAFLGRLDLELEKAEGEMRVTSVEGRLIPLDATVKPDRRTLATLQRKMAPLRRVVCTAATGLPNPEEGASPMAEWVAEEIREAVHADVALLDRGAVCAPIEAGPVTRADVYRIHPYRNRVLLMEVTPEQLRVALAEADGFIAAGCTFEKGGNGVEALRVGGVSPGRGGTWRMAVGEYGRSLLPSLKDGIAVDSGRRIDIVLLEALKAGRLPRLD